MGRIMNKANDHKYKQHGKVLKELMKELKVIIKNKENVDDEQLKSFMMKLLEEKELLTADIERIRPKGFRNPWDFSKEKTQKVFVEDDVIFLRPVCTEDYDSYIQCARENSDLGSKFYDNDENCRDFWEDLWKEESFWCGIIRKKDQKFIGYCGIKNTTYNIWEVGLELLIDSRNRGYGYRTINLFLNKISEITTEDQFQCLVEVDNIACQLLMKKMHARLIDIQEWLFNEEEALEFEEGHLDEIDDHMIELAEYLEVEPRKLLSHVLDYRIMINENFFQEDKTFL